jgi:hypothetical protein
MLRSIVLRGRPGSYIEDKKKDTEENKRFDVNKLATKDYNTMINPNNFVYSRAAVARMLGIASQLVNRTYARPLDIAYRV